MEYAHRIFADKDADSFDAGYFQPQYIGLGEGENEYRLKGLFLPVDEEGEEYVMQRRVETLYPEISGSQAAMFKSSPHGSTSPSRWTSRSKFGSAFVMPTKAKSSSSSSSRAVPSSTHTPPRSSPY